MKIESAKKEKEKKKNEKKSEVSEDQIKVKKKLDSRFQKLEVELQNAKKLKVAIEAELGDPAIYQNANKFQMTMEKFNQHETILDQITKEWEEVFEALSLMEE